MDYTATVLAERATTFARRYIDGMPRVVVVFLAMIGSAICQSTRSAIRTGDGAPALKAEINGPSSIAVDDQDNIYVYELAGGAIRRIDGRRQVITTIAQECNPPWQKPRPSGCVGPVSGLRVESGRLLLSEFTYNRVSAIDLRSGSLTVIAGNGDLRFGGDGGNALDAGITVPHCLTSDLAGNIIVCDSGHRIRRIDRQTGIIATIAGNGRRGFGGDGGPALDAEFVTPLSVAVDNSGSIYVADDTSNRIRRVDGKSGAIETIVGSGPSTTGNFCGIEFAGEGGPATRTQFCGPRGLAFDRNGDLLFVISGRVCRIDKQGLLQTVAGTGVEGFSGDGGPARNAKIGPSAITVDHRGNILIAEYANNRIRRINVDTGVITTIAGNGLPHRPPQPIL